jgi:hypothetical protein
MAEIDLNLPYVADAELSEEHQAAFILCLLKNSNNMPNARITLEMSHLLL